MQSVPKGKSILTVVTDCKSALSGYIGTQQWPRKEDHEKRATILKEHAQLQYDKAPKSNKDKLMMSVTLKVV